MPFARQLAFAALAALATVASAQQIFRIVGPDGRVTFSDQPPVEPNAKAAPAAVVPLPGAAPASGAGLPFELRQVAARYPVTLYTGPSCGPCETGREFLTRRGIPYAERTVNSNQDVEALQRLSGTPALPFLTIGGQQLKGYSEIEWGQFLDAAGYPKTSVLPATYRAAAPTPLVSVQEAPAPATAAARPSPSRPAAPAVAAPAPSNPAGIRF